MSIAATRDGDGWRADLLDTFLSFRQTYGYFEARVRIPEGRGLWAAFWLGHDWQSTKEEIDIAEVCANPPGTHDNNDITLLHQIIHGTDGGHVGGLATRMDDITDWHVYGLDWRPDHIAFDVDGQELWRFTDVAKIPSVPMAIVLDVTVGGWCGSPNATTPSPSVMQVDWVRATR